MTMAKVGKGEGENNKISREERQEMDGQVYVSHYFSFVFIS